ncbi:serine acetyltransferase [Hymenobacter busanensis]|uniref:Serine acetyltransferase n=1 Tax=Hymenobacter busanensis TaxID=2607656 RepID=A0A7L5A233_9BACT|nr:serine O-acetyltransferase [Hymenobacter busanensis]KAA9325529.1 serine acetyltransferase [Hymenobacter busanensis]QHJ07800.1 serine acetyltransferase [Hymenobacter busanensis]
MPHTFFHTLAAAHQAAPAPLPTAAFVGLAERLLDVLFPERSADRLAGPAAVAAAVQHLEHDLAALLPAAPALPRPPQELAAELVAQLPALHELLLLDAQAILAADPAAQDLAEVIGTYPGFYALALHRLAHALHRRGVRLLPRLLSEHAHQRTGIDIHPGARIGRSCSIDHGTGIVIGETAVIGDHVRLFQGVTLGALSVAKELASIKRHPTIEDHVVVYAGATILGGSTVVGRHSIIGGNVWLTESVPSHSRVYHRAQLHVTRTEDPSADLVFSI